MPHSIGVHEYKLAQGLGSVPIPVESGIGLQKHIETELKTSNFMDFLNIQKSPGRIMLGRIMLGRIMQIGLTGCWWQEIHLAPVASTVASAPLAVWNTRLK